MWEHVSYQAQLISTHHFYVRTEVVWREIATSERRFWVLVRGGVSFSVGWAWRACGLTGLAPWASARLLASLASSLRWMVCSRNVFSRASHHGCVPDGLGARWEQTCITSQCHFWTWRSWIVVRRSLLRRENPFAIIRWSSCLSGCISIYLFIFSGRHFEFSLPLAVLLELDFWLPVCSLNVVVYRLIRPSLEGLVVLQCSALKLFRWAPPLCPPGNGSLWFSRLVICTNLVDPASSHMLVSKIKPCMSQ